MRRLLILASSAALLAATPALAQGKPQGAPPQPKLSQEDKQFVDFAAEDNQAEIQLCLLAEKLAQGPALKAFARLMVNDHVEIESRLAALINAENVEVPTGTGKDGQETFAKMEKLRGEAFDREFLKKQIEDHGHDLEKFEHQRSATQNEGSRQFAAETLPILQQHDQLARAVQAAMDQHATK